MVEWEVQDRAVPSAQAQGSLAGFLERARCGKNGERGWLLQAEGVLSHPSLASMSAAPFRIQPDLGDNLPHSRYPGGSTRLIVAVGDTQTRLCRNTSRIEWQRLALGRKHWVFLSPDTEGLAPRTLTNPSLQVSEVRIFSSWDILEISQDTGELIIIPPGWWHMSRSQQLSIGIASDFCDEAAACAGDLAANSADRSTAMALPLAGGGYGGITQPGMRTTKPPANLKMEYVTDIQPCLLRHAHAG